MGDGCLVLGDGWGLSVTGGRLTERMMSASAPVRQATGRIITAEVSVPLPFLEQSLQLIHLVEISGDQENVRGDPSHRIG